ncbi:tRNA1(Val) (adenine(37)-N6)-methyltransferase [Pseudanabaena sp. 'Roaring Creek']|uniref:tRNA1(Val) (adenine(37)-N6)-methyltransferase n=1 Tax=Pseudanabaena sp. 'Roaring Creek' TaxID=1681830 RepID=UPI0009EA64DA|nr:methyltransferase [Pseudanabaena sp. 'Roaring Creek']
MRIQNSSFRFKKFTVNQDRCTMKVGTDGILLGASASLPEPAQILDIGTGTGLLALMLAQRSPSANTSIDAVEIDTESYHQAKENIQQSPWGDRINIYRARIQDFAIACPQQYDLIISNPPFFINSYKSPQASRNLARHSDSLPQTDILQIARQLLKPHGHLAIIYPTDLAKKFLDHARDFDLFCDRQVYIKPMPQSAIERILLELSPTKYPVRETFLTIEEEKHVYTPDYLRLVKDFYLYL